MNTKIVFVPLRLKERSLFDRIFRKMKWPEFWFVNDDYGIKFRSKKTEGYVLCFAESLNSETCLPSFYWLLDYEGRNVNWYTVLFTKRGTILTVLNQGSLPYDSIRNKKTGQVYGGYDVIRKIRGEGKVERDYKAEYNG